MLGQYVRAKRRISTHALTEGDTMFFCIDGSRLLFQLTPSRRATDRISFLHGQVDISTHALTEGDDLVGLDHICSSHFNSRPHGGRLRSEMSFLIQRYFNSRPHGGRLRASCAKFPTKQYFNSRPHGGRRQI